MVASVTTRPIVSVSMSITPASRSSNTSHPDPTQATIPAQTLRCHPNSLSTQRFDAVRPPPRHARSVKPTPSPAPVPRRPVRGRYRRRRRNQAHDHSLVRANERVSRRAASAQIAPQRSLLEDRRRVEHLLPARRVRSSPQFLLGAEPVELIIDRLQQHLPALLPPAPRTHRRDACPG